MEDVLGPQGTRPGGPAHDPEDWIEERGNSGGDEDNELSSDDTHVTREEMRESGTRLAQKAPLYGHAGAPRLFKYCTGRQKRLVLYYTKVFRRIFGRGQTGKRETLPRCVVLRIREMYRDDARDIAAQLLGDEL